MTKFDIDQIKKFDIKQVISKETDLQFKKNVLEHCPFCNSGNNGKNSDSAFTIQPSKNIFRCWSCDIKGNPIDFITQYKKLKNGEAINYLGEKYNLDAIIESTPEPEQKTDLSKTIYAISRNDKSPAAEYLKSRKIDVEQLPKDAFHYDKLSNAVVFIDSEQKTVNKRLIAPKNGQSKSMQAKGSTYKNMLYLSAFNPKKDKVFLVESPINALSLYPHSAIAIFSTNNLFTDAKKLAKYLKNKTAVLAFDNDAKNKHNAGGKCTDYYHNFILQNIDVSGLLKLKLPDNKDVNDLQQTGELKEYISNTDNYEYIEYDIFKTPLRKNDKSISKRYKIENSCYSVRNKQGDFYEISDCIFNFMYRFNDEDGTRLIKLQQTEIDNKNRIEIIELTSKDLKKDSFETALSKVGFSFFGSSINLAHITTDLKHREKLAEIINTYGWQPDNKMFAFTDCVINSNNEILQPNTIGIVNDNDSSYYLPTASPVNKHKLSELKQFSYKQGKADFKAFAELFYKANKANGSIGIQFFILSLFRDIIFNNLDFFPYLYLYGEAGAGKTSYVDSLLGLFGDESKGHGLKNISQAALSRIASQKRNTLIYWKEYSKEVPNYVEDYLKTGYDGQARTISSGGTSKETISFGIESSAVIDSNFLPTNETAVFTRMIILDFELTNFTLEQTAAYEKLKDHEKQGLAQITKELLKHRELFEDNFKDVFYSVLTDLKRKGLKKQFSHERTIKHIALIITPFHILSSELNFPYDITTLENTIIDHALAQEEKLHAFKSTNMFWQALAYFQNEGKIKAYEYESDKKTAYYHKQIKDAENGSIYIKSTKLNDLLTKYASYCKLQGISPDKIDKPVELKSKLLSKGYEPFQPNTNKERQAKNNIYIGYSYEFRFTIKSESDGIYINNQEIDL